MYYATHFRTNKDWVCQLILTHPIFCYDSQSIKSASLEFFQLLKIHTEVDAEVACAGMVIPVAIAWIDIGEGF